MRNKKIKQTLLFLLISGTLYGQQLSNNNGRVVSAPPTPLPIKVLTQPSYLTEVSTETEDINTEIKNNAKAEEVDHSLSDFNFMYLYYKTIESSLNRNRRVGKLGRKTIDGLKSGSFYYHCRLGGWDKVIITMTYTNYCDFDFIINGTTQVLVNFKANGVMIGKIEASGLASGIINYDLKLNNSVECAGHYMLQRAKNDYKLKVPYELVLSFSDRDIELDKKCTVEQ